MDSHCDRGGRGEHRRADGVLLSLGVAFGEHERPHLPFYAVIDAVETTLNVWSDSCVAAMVDKDLFGERDAR